MTINKDKFKDIWQEYQYHIKAFLYSKISNPADADDLLQEILMKTYEKLETLKSEISVKSWLFQIANHSIVDFYRKKKNQQNSHVDDLWYEEDDVGITEALAQCIEPFIAMPQESAALLKAIDIKGKSQKEYAAEIGISYSTLKSRVQKERQNLRKIFEDCCLISFNAQGNISDFEEKSNNCKNC